MIIGSDLAGGVYLYLSLCLSAPGLLLPARPLFHTHTHIYIYTDGTTNFVHGYPFVTVSIGLLIEKAS